MTSLLIAFAALLSPEPATGPAEPDEIVVQGERPERSPHGAAEQPYPETERVPLGSRIPRRVRERPFRSIPSDTGLAGLIANGSAGFDATGGQHVQGRGRRAIECVAPVEEVREEVACILFRAARATERGELEAAEAALRPLLARQGLTRWELYYLGDHLYRLGQAADEPLLREQALRILVASGRMDEPGRQAALRALAALALRRGDEPAAIALLDALAEATPGDVRVRANLAALHVRAGREDLARARLAEAAALLRAAGETPPEEWTALLADPLRP